MCFVCVALLLTAIDNCQCASMSNKLINQGVLLGQGPTVRMQRATRQSHLCLVSDYDCRILPYCRVCVCASAKDGRTWNPVFIWNRFDCISALIMLLYQWCSISTLLFFLCFVIMICVFVVEHGDTQINNHLSVMPPRAPIPILKEREREREVHIIIKIEQRH